VHAVARDISRRINLFFLPSFPISLSLFCAASSVFCRCRYRTPPLAFVEIERDHLRIVIATSPVITHPRWSTASKPRLPCRHATLIVIKLDDAMRIGRCSMVQRRNGIVKPAVFTDSGRIGDLVSVDSDLDQVSTALLSPRTHLPIGIDQEVCSGPGMRNTEKYA